MKIIFHVALLTALFLQSNNILAQSGEEPFPKNSPNILPPSPDAYNFTKYGNLPIGINTGTAQFSLPVYTIEAGTLNHAISINYSSNGVKVDEMATRTGINWSLKAGGVITRTILDLPDDAPGVHPVFYSGLANADYDKWDFYNYVKQASLPTPPDYQPDEYSEYSSG